MYVCVCITQLLFGVHPRRHRKLQKRLLPNGKCDAGLLTVWTERQWNSWQISWSTWNVGLAHHFLTGVAWGRKFVLISCDLAAQYRGAFEPEATICIRAETDSDGDKRAENSCGILMGSGETDISSM